MGSLLWSILGVGAVGVLEHSVEVDAIDEVDNTGVEGSKGITSHEGMKDRLDGLSPVDALLTGVVEGSSSFLLVGVADSIEIDPETFIPERLYIGPCIVEKLICCDAVVDVTAIAVVNLVDNIDILIPILYAFRKHQTFPKVVLP